MPPDEHTGSSTDPEGNFARLASRDMFAFAHKSVEAKGATRAIYLC